MRNLFMCLVLLIGLSQAANSQVIHCGATTTKGEPCKNRVKQIGLKCWHHADNGTVNGSANDGNGSIVFVCGANTTKNKPCKRRVAIQGAKCYHHQ